METQAFEIIQGIIADELTKQDFGEAKEIEIEDCKAYMYTGENVAYSVMYDYDRQSFLLKSTSLTDEGLPGDWRQLAQWLFDKEEGTKADAESIGNDFLDIIRGPKRMAAVQTAKRKKKKGDDENNIDPMFFYNRLVGVFPEFKNELNEERITYGQVRFATLAKSSVAPKIENLGKTQPNSDEFAKIKTLIADMYKNGDGDLCALISAGILNNIDDESVISALSENFDDTMKKNYKCSRKLRGKNIKPEKKKKQKKIVAAALNNANK